MSRFAIYDFATCREALEAHARELAAAVEGIERWASFREFVEAFAREAWKNKTTVLGQFDPDLVFVFAPFDRPDHVHRESRWVSVLELASELLGQSGEGPYWVNFVDAFTRGESPKSTMLHHRWLPDDLTGLLVGDQLAIWVFFNAKRFLGTVLLPQLEKRGFTVLPDESDELTPVVRVRHPNRPRATYLIPWAEWLREMIAGGFNLLYLLEILSLYLQKLEYAVQVDENKEDE